MAQAGTMPPDRAEQPGPGFSKRTDYSANCPAGLFPHRGDGLVSDIAEEQCDHFRKHPTAGAFGLAHFHEIIQRLEELRVAGARQLFHQASPTDPNMSRNDDSSEARTSCDPGDTHPPYDNEDRAHRDYRQNRTRSPRFKEARRCRKEEEVVVRHEEPVLGYSSSLDTHSHQVTEEAGAMRSQFCSPRHQPYAMNEERLSRSPRSNENIPSSYESTTERILRDKEYSEMLNPCMDQLKSAGSASWYDTCGTKTTSHQERRLPADSVSLPSIVIDDPREESFFVNVFPQEALSSRVEVYAEAGNSAPGMATFNVENSRSGSRASSRAQSPGSLLNLESPIIQNISYSPVGSPQIGGSLAVGYCSSESSNQSYSDIPSPLSYQSPLNPRSIAHLGNEVRRLILWNDECGCTEAMPSSTAIDNTELQMLEEVLRQDLHRTNTTEEPQVVPTSNQPLPNALCSDEQTCIPNCCCMNLQCEYTRNLSCYKRASDTIPIPSSSDTSYLGGRSIASGVSPTAELPDWGRSDHLDDFEIPRIVASFESSSTRRCEQRNVMPWPTLNLPSVGASERLKEGLNPKEVERAMGSLLKRTLEELARADEDGDTMLMLLVGDPEEFAKKKAYLVPLVERLSNSRDALAMTNNRGEDALYLAAMNCPRTPYVAGYLAAAMLRKGIDISQRLYHTRGDTLIHSVAARGDSHGEVLTELLALRTCQGNAVFDLSKRNYDGRTALHAAVESHSNASIETPTSSWRSVQVLLENGSERNATETKRGDTALHMAISLSCDPELVKILLVGVNEDTVNATNYHGDTPLHMVAAVSRTVSLEMQSEVCRILIEAGAQRNIENRRGETPLALVSPERKDAIRRILYKKT